MWRAGLRLVRYGCSNSMARSKFPVMQKVSFASSDSMSKVPNIANLVELLSSGKASAAYVSAVEEELCSMRSRIGDPDCLDRLISGSWFYIYLGRPEFALEFLKLVIAMPSPEDPVDFLTVRLGAPLQAAECCTRQGKTYEAIGYLEPIASLEVPENVFDKEAYYNGITKLEKCLCEVGRKDDAAKYEKIILARGPESLGVLTSKIAFLMRKEKYEEALKFVDRAITMPYDQRWNVLFMFQARIWGSSCCFVQGKFNEAIGYLEPIARMKAPKACYAKDSYYAGITLLGNYLFKVGRKDDAAKNEKIIFDEDPAAYARRIPDLPDDYKEFVESLKYV